MAYPPWSKFAIPVATTSAAGDRPSGFRGPGVSRRVLSIDDMQKSWTVTSLNDDIRISTVRICARK
jgi:hypothetical protein